MQKRIRPNKLLLPVVLFLVTSCSLTTRLSRNQQEKLLIENLTKWETFQLEGLIEVNYKAFSFRKNIILKKAKEKVRLDIFDTGLLGLSPSPFISAYLDTSLVLRLPGNEDMIEIPGEKLQEDLAFLKYLTAPRQLLQFKADIIADQYLKLDDLSITFSRDMQINEISKENDIAVQFLYTDELSEIIFSRKGSKVADIMIDKITFSEVDISELKQ